MSPSSIPRRAFVRGGAFALLSLGVAPRFLTGSLLSASGTARKKTLICVFQRGAVDGLNMVVPFGDTGYYARRGSIAVPAPGAEGGAIDLDGFFGLHPSLAPLHDLYGRGELAIVHAVGSPHPTRSHFDAQDFMETGTPGVKSTADGWLNRVLSETACTDCDGRTLIDPAAHAADHASGQSGLAMVPALRGVALGSALPRALRGRHEALAIADLERFGVAGGDAGLENTFSNLYRSEAGEVVGRAADGAFDAIEILKSVNPAAYRPASGVQYPAGNFGRALLQIAQLLKAGVGIEVAFTDIGGWDTHRVQGGSQGQLATRFNELARGIRALNDDLGDLMEDVVVLTMSEFGRTVAENGSGGTDHGTASCMFVAGGGVNGGRVFGDWPGLAREQLHEGRDLARTTDFRDLFSEVASGHLGVESLDAVFPGHAVDRANWRGVL